jgi:hypothetical protein
MLAGFSKEAGRTTAFIASRKALERRGVVDNHFNAFKRAHVHSDIQIVTRRNLVLCLNINCLVLATYYIITDY